ncbi:amidase [Burkholderia sp. WAC0059]|uniref:amidase n=1 Tax=Burkholderia sp. WAC0059 TaxID=2066022 RepID=UPI000C7F2CE5|nr:amidase [Burkholderia sp. WAC0059]PLZ02273.1 amidase [Burkholderia sp. WAC0059]
MRSPAPASQAFIPYPDVAVAHAATGPLAGLHFAVKDLYDVAGYPTSAGNPHVLAMSGIKTRHAPVVAALLDAGAAFVGKTVTDELAFSARGNNAHFGAPLNGAAPARITGGSSSGSASAVSTGLADFALGSDTGGSVRGPANHCGLYGIRPTQDRLSLDGCFPLCRTFDTCGFLARDPSVFARVAAVLLGADRTPLPARPRLLLATDLFALVEAPVAAALQPAVEAIEAAYGPAQPVAAAGGRIGELYTAYRVLQGWEAWQGAGELIERHGLRLGADVAQRFAFAKQVSAAEAEAADAVRTAFTAALKALLGDDGVLIAPSMPDIAPLLDTDAEAFEIYRNRATHLLGLSPLCGFPQLSLPFACRDGAPLGISLMGPHGSDLSLVELASRIAAPPLSLDPAIGT